MMMTNNDMMNQSSPGGKHNINNDSKKKKKNSTSSSTHLCAPSDLYPVVTDLDDLKDSCGYPDFGSHQLNDTTAVNSIPNDDSKRNTSRPIRNQRDSSESYQVTSSTTRNAPQPLHHPLLCDNLATDLSSHQSEQFQGTDHHNHRRRRGSQSRRHTEPRLQTAYSSDDDQPQVQSQPKSGRKMHLRRKSRQLMNLLKSGPLTFSSSSSKDLSTCTTDFSVESECVERKFHANYILTRQITNCIWECIQTTSGLRFCVKILEAEQEQEVRMLMLAQTNVEESHFTDIVEVIGDGNKLYVVMEMVVGTNLLSRVVQEGAMDEDIVKEVTRSILEGLSFLHSTCCVVHADLQPDNILLTMAGDDVWPDKTKISDMGSAVDLCVHKPVGTKHGNSLFSAPEIIQGDAFDTSADIWSVGCLVHLMLNGSSPFESTACARNKISRAEFAFPPLISRQAKQFLALTVHVDPSVRMTAAEALDHPWLKLEDDELQESVLHLINLGHEPSLCSSSSMDTSVHTHQYSSQGSPSRTGKKRHHRRLSSLGKGLSKLFF